jgi:hypothetical protein
MDECWLVTAMMMPMGMKRMVQMPRARSRPYQGRWIG